MARPPKHPNTARASSAASQTSGRRGRPTADRIQAIEEDIRAAALEIFLEVGFEAASMDAIAARAPVSKGTLYARFDSKQQLFRAVIEEELESLSKAAGEKDHLLPPEIEPRLRHHARTILEVFDWPQFRAFGQLIEGALRTFPEFESVWHDLATGRYVRFLANDIAHAADAPNLSLEDSRYLAQLFLQSVSGFHRSGGARGNEARNDTLAFADRVIDTIMREIDFRR